MIGRQSVQALSRDELSVSYRWLGASAREIIGEALLAEQAAELTSDAGDILGEGQAGARS